MAKKSINEKAMNIKNDKLEEIIEAFKTDNSKENLIQLMTEIRKCRVLVPGEFPKNMTDEQKGYIERREPFPEGKAPQILPLLVQNEEGKRYAPCFTSKKQIEDPTAYQVMLTIRFQEVMRVASAPNANLQGIMVNPQTTKLILHPKFIENMKKLEAELANKNGEVLSRQPGGAAPGQVLSEPPTGAAPGQVLSEPPTGAEPGAQPRQIKMTRDEFVVFARRSVEQGSLPKAVFADSAAFFEKLEEDGAGTVCGYYRQPYGDKLPAPYADEQFGVMLLDIDDETALAVIDLPEIKQPLICRSIYLVRNPKADTLRYFTIETDQEDPEKELLCEHTHGKKKVIGDAPETGTEMYCVLDIIDSEK